MMKLKFKMHWNQKNTYLLKLIVLISMIAAIVSCGRKAPPIAPYLTDIPAALKLAADIEGETLVLSWEVPMRNNQVYPGLDGFVIYRDTRALAETDCVDCPPNFEQVADIPIELRDTLPNNQNRMKYREKLERGYQYTYKIRTYGKKARGKDSTIVRFSF